MDNFVSLLIICPVVFLYALNSNFTTQVSAKTIALASTAIYLIHPWVIIALKTLHNFDSLSLAALTIACSFILSLGLIRINRYVKVL